MVYTNNYWYYTPYIVSDRNQFVMLSLVYANGVINAYRNGALLGTKNQTVSVATNNSAIGRHYFSSGLSTTHFSGIIDEVRIYNRALTESELLQLYNQ